MKAVILAGGLGTRLSEETSLKPKPMVEIGGMPILWHIMKIYSFYGVNEFIICCGHKGYMIKEYFSNYFLHGSDVMFNLEENSMKILNKTSENWKITCVDTGQDTMTGGRLRKVSEYLKDENTFCLTYGDGVSNINISDLIKFHNEHGLDATLSAVVPPSRFGALHIENGIVKSFQEKPEEEQGKVNGGFFVLSQNEFYNKYSGLLFMGFIIQFYIGIMTLLLKVPIVLGILHQGMAVLLLLIITHIKFLMINTQSINK